MTNIDAAEELRSAIDHALAAGITRAEIFAMAAKAPPPSAVRETWPEQPGEIKYDEVPAGMITLPDAASKYGVRHNTLNVAVYRGMLPIAGRVTRRHGNGKAGGITLTVVAEAALRHYLGLPPDPEAAPDGDAASTPRNQTAKLPLYDELPDGLITVSDAARTYDVPSRRLHWLASNAKLARMGYLRADSRRGRSALLLSEAEVAELIEANDA